MAVNFQLNLSVTGQCLVFSSISYILFTQYPIFVAHQIYLTIQQIYQNMPSIYQDCQLSPTVSTMIYLPQKFPPISQHQPHHLPTVIVSLLQIRSFVVFPGLTSTCENHPCPASMTDRPNSTNCDTALSSVQPVCSTTSNPEKCGPPQITTVWLVNTTSAPERRGPPLSPTLAPHYTNQSSLKAPRESSAVQQQRLALSSGILGASHMRINTNTIFPVQPHLTCSTTLAPGKRGPSKISTTWSETATSAPERRGPPHKLMLPRPATLAPQRWGPPHNLMLLSSPVLTPTGNLGPRKKGPTTRSNPSP